MPKKSKKKSQESRQKRSLTSSESTSSNFQDRTLSPSNRALKIGLAALIAIVAIGLSAYSLWLRGMQQQDEELTASTGMDPQLLPQASSMQPEIHYLGPDEFYLNRIHYVRDENGETKLNTVLLPHLPDKQPALSPPSKAGFVGPDACAECHAQKHGSFLKTSHAQTSALAKSDSILGSFSVGENTLKTKSPDLSFEMLERDGKFWQRMLIDSHGGEPPMGAEFPIDLVTGSGKVGQTYLYWQGEHLYQLHASYLKMTDRWMNSPGYEDGVANFARPILSFCLECHATYVQPYESTANQYHRENMVLGVTCEKCHGPGAEHVAFHRENPQVKEAAHIVNPADLPVERSLELCQLCHGGTPAAKVQDSFTYRPGNELGDHYEYPEISGDTVKAGIHTNSQLPRLKRSQCFAASDKMTCINCHNPHQFERGNMQLFSDRCMACHDQQACGKFEQLGDRLSENCIDCHMPSLEVDDIKLYSEGQELVPTMRDHFIKVWPEATTEYLERIGRSEK